MANHQHRTAVLILVALFAAAFWSRPVLAQYTTASLAGKVTDQSGGAVPEAKVTVKSTDTGLLRSASTGNDGTFLFPLLHVGAYRLTVAKPGFSTYSQDGIVLTVNQAASQDVTLQLASVAAQVEVTANAEMINTQNGTLSQLVDQHLMTELPLNGRTPESLLFITPGAVNLGFPPGGQGGVYPTEQGASVGGGGRMNVNYQLDGGAHNDTYVAQAMPFPNPDAVREFNVQTTNMSAEYGGAQTVVSIVTRSGSNQLHGTAFEFLRNNALNARNYFSIAPDTLKRNQFGGSVGGRILKDKLFFFGTYQGTRIRSTPASLITFVPTAAQLSGDFSAIQTQLKNPFTGDPFANNQIPTGLFSPAAKYFLGLLPSAQNSAGRVTFVGPRAIQQDDQFMPKLDWNRGKNQLSGRYFYSRYQQPPDTTTVRQNLVAMDHSGLYVRVQTVALNDTYTASPSLSFNTWFGWDSHVGGTVSGVPTDNPIDFTAAGVKIAGGAPGVPPALEQLFVSGFFTVQSSHQGNFNRGGWQVRESVTKEMHSHELIFGGEAVRVVQDITNTNSQSGTINFNSAVSGSNLVDFLLGYITTFQQGAGQYQFGRGMLYGLFVQDNWRASSKLKLNLGLRWDPALPYKEIKNHILCFRPGQQSQRYPNAPLGLIFGGDPGCPAETGRYGVVANFAPRFGFAYQVARKTVVRGGAGVYYGVGASAQLNGSGTTAPFSPSFTLSGASFDDPWGSKGIANPFPAQFTGGNPPGADAPFILPVQVVKTFDLHWHPPTLATWNLMVERQVRANWLFGVGYLGDGGWHLSNSGSANTNTESNPAIYIPGQSTVGNTQARRSISGLSTVNMMNSGNNSHYHALQVRVERRMNHGLSLVANSVWSKNMDNFPVSTFGTTNPFNRNFDWGRSDLDRPFVLHVSGVWHVPGRLRGVAGTLLNGWELSSITTWQSGSPFSILSGAQNSFSGVGIDRADFVGTSLSQVKLSGLSHYQWQNVGFFDTSNCPGPQCLFQNNAVGTFGNTEKNILQGPRFFNEDLGAFKNFKVTERLNIQFRGEFFNVFNNVNFTSVNNIVGGAGFGKVGSAASPRILQVALKLAF